MSLYNNARETGSVTSELGGGRLDRGLSGIGGNIVSGLANRYIPYQVRSGVGVVEDVLNGDLTKAGARLLDSGLLGSLFPSMLGDLASQLRFWGTPTPLFGGISPEEARQISTRVAGTNFSKKNLFLIEVSGALQGDISDHFNLFANDVEYAPMTISGEKHRVGGAFLDSVNGAEPVEMRIVTKDDQDGTIKRWFAAQFGAVVAEDGTVGLPATYAVRIKVVHAFITQASNRDGYEDVGLFRPHNIDMSLSRSENGLQEIAMTFQQLDTFMR